MSQIQLHGDAALNAMADARLKPSDIDGIATAGDTPVTIAHCLGLTRNWSTTPRSAAVRRMEAKIRSIGAVQLPHSHRMLVRSVLVSRCRIVFEGVGDA
jgi:3-oxoacyl-[acyl-carrier-protein] synthase III